MAERKEHGVHISSHVSYSLLLIKSLPPSPNHIRVFFSILFPWEWSEKQRHGQEEAPQLCWETGSDVELCLPLEVCQRAVTLRPAMYTTSRNGRGQRGKRRCTLGPEWQRKSVLPGISRWKVKPLRPCSGSELLALSLSPSPPFLYC